MENLIFGKNKIKGLFSYTSIITMLMLSYIIYDNLIHRYESFKIEYYIYWIVVLSLACTIYLASKNQKRSIILISFFILISVITIIVSKKFSIIDEAAHFDYINYIIRNHKLPTLYDNIDIQALSKVFSENIGGNVINHEAVQPPLYYIIIAALTFCVKDIALRMLVARFLGTTCLILIYIVICKTTSALVDCKLLKDKYLTLNLILFLLLFNPGTISRLSFVSNEHFTSLLASILTYFIVQLIIKGFSKKYFWLCNFALVGLILTKTTTVFFIGVMIFVLFYYKKIREIFICCGVVLLGISPWIVFNYKIYNAFTGIKEHVAFVIQIVNPQRLPIDIIESIFKLFNTYFLQEYQLSESGIMLLHFMSLFLLYLCIKYFIFTIRNIISFTKRKFIFNYSNEEKLIIIKTIFTIIVVLNILVLVFGTITTKVNVILGRYLYISIIPLICLMEFTINDWKEKYVKYYCICISLFLSISFVSLITSVANQNNNILGSFAEVVEKIDGNNEKTIESYTDMKLEYKNNDLEVTSGSIDPQMIWSRSNDKRFSALRLMYDTNTGGVVQIFYAGEDRLFSEGNSCKKDIKVGKNNETYFIVPKGFETKYIRLDPPNDSDLIIKSIELLN